MCPMETRRDTLAETWRHGALGTAVTGECWNIKIFIPRVSDKYTALAYRDRDSRGILTVF